MAVSMWWNLIGWPTESATAGSQKRLRNVLRRKGPPSGAVKISPSGPAGWSSRCCSMTSGSQDGGHGQRPCRREQHMGSLVRYR